MPKVYNITNWSEQPWLNTGGTRNKKIYLNPGDSQLYYFKQSLKKEKKDYKYEFWSEIIAYELGHLCGFNVLPYHIAIRNHEVGCISKSMINPDVEELVEGGRYIQAFDNTFNPDDRSLRHQYSFDIVIKALQFLAFKNILVILSICWFLMPSLVTVIWKLWTNATWPIPQFRRACRFYHRTRPISGGIL